MGEIEPYEGQSGWRLYLWRELAALAVMGMELSWLALWFRIFTQTGLFVSFWRAYAVLGGTFGSVYLLARVASLLRLRLALQRWVMGGLLGVSLLFGLKTLYFVNRPLGLKELLLSPVQAFIDRDIVIAAEFMVMLAMLWVWWRGISLVGSSIGPASVRGSFLTGAIALSAYGLIAPLTGEIPAAPLYLFLFCGLLALSAARVHVIGRMGRGRPVPFDRKWLAGMVLSSIGLVGLAIFVVFLVQWKLSTVVVTLAVWAWRLIFVVGMTLLAPVLLVLMAVVPPLARFLERPVLQAVQILRDFIQEVQGFAVRLGLAIDLAIGDLSLRIGVDPVRLKQVLFGAMLVLAVVWVLWSLGILRFSSIRNPGEGAQSLISPGEGLRRLAAALQSRARSLAGEAGRWIDLHAARKRRAAARIRRIYAALLEMSETLGRPRPAAQTPLEYLAQLNDLFPGYAGDLELITRAYIQVRYGEVPESLPEVAAVQTAWQRIQAGAVERLKVRR